LEHCKRAIGSEFVAAALCAVASPSLVGSRELFADQNQNARYERQNSHHDCADADVKERSD
jgi:hypothetical protein